MRVKRFAFLGVALVLGACCVWSYVRAGELNPPGMPTGTMRTLNEVYAAAFEPVKVPLNDSYMLGTLYLSVTEIPGECTEMNHPNWIDLYGYTLHIENGGSLKGEPYPKFSNLLVAKRTDRASVPLMQKCCDNTRIPEIILERARPNGPSQPVVYYRLVLFDARVTYLAPVSAETPLMEVVSFGGFTRVRWEYRTIDATGAPGEWLTQEWDIPGQGGES